MDVRQKGVGANITKRPLSQQLQIDRLYLRERKASVTEWQSPGVIPVNVLKSGQLGRRRILSIHSERNGSWDGQLCVFCLQVE